MLKHQNNTVGENNLTTDTPGLMDILGCGRQTAVRIGTDAGAKVTIGKRVLWNIPKIRRYVDSLSL